MTKLWTVVIVLMLSISTQSHAKNNDLTFKKLRKNLWYMGVNGPSPEQVDLQIEHEAKDSESSPKAPEELSKALEKALAL